MFDTYRCLEFSLDQVGQFIDRWFVQKPGLGQKLRTELDQAGKERIKDMVRNPLQLALLCYYWQLRQGALPATKAALYERFLEAFYEWKQERFPTTSAVQQELNTALGRLAVAALNQKESRYRLRHRFVRSVLGEPDAAVFQTVLQLGWLTQIGVAAEDPDEKVYAFFHPTFQEYFAARGFEEWKGFLQHNAQIPSEGTYEFLSHTGKKSFCSGWDERMSLRNGKKNFSVLSRTFMMGAGTFITIVRIFLQRLGLPSLQTTLGVMK
jgi:predicted NACHT family NTPase